MKSYKHVPQVTSVVCFTPIPVLPKSSTSNTSFTKICRNDCPRRIFSLRSTLSPPPWPLPSIPTPISPLEFRGRTVFVKRDDQLNFAGISGSKLRKFYSLFRDPAFHQATHLISYGGAQSNAMLALAQLCQFHEKPFVYITRPISPRLSKAPGNFRDALAVGMSHVQVSLDDYRTTFTDIPPDIIESEIELILHKNNCTFPFSTSRPYFVPQGGAWSGAEPGVSILASEIVEQISTFRKSGKFALKLPVIFLACGTGTTAFFLRKHLKGIAKVVAVPVSGSEIYLVKQMRWLHQVSTSDTSSMDKLLMPDVLRPRLRASFADVRPEKLRLWQELHRAVDGKFDFDLIYAPKAWEEVWLAIEERRIASDGEDLIYYHSGGVEGNASMLGMCHSANFHVTASKNMCQSRD